MKINRTVFEEIITIVCEHIEENRANHFYGQVSITKGVWMFHGIKLRSDKFPDDTILVDLEDQIILIQTTRHAAKYIFNLTDKNKRLHEMLWDL